MKAFVIAGEPSGDRLGAALMGGLHKLCDDTVEIVGVGGELMEAEGLTSIYPMDEIVAMGIVEIIGRYRQLRRKIRETADRVIAENPDVLITIDLPDFNLRVSRMVRAAAPDIRIVHYVAPTVWAWRPKRAARMAEYVDQVLALLPFEPPFMHEVGMRCDFVGHPVVTEPQASEAEAAAFRMRHGFGDAPLALVLPGSRKSEIARLMPIFGVALGQVRAARPDLKFVLVATRATAGPVFEAIGGTGWAGGDIRVLDPRDMTLEAAQAEKRAAFRAADMALAASGTVSLELAAAATPMVIAYDMNWFSREIIRRSLRVDSVTLVNLISETRVIPEFIGSHCRPDLIADALIKLAAAPQTQTEAMRLAMLRLGFGGRAPGDIAAAAVLDGLHS